MSWQSYIDDQLMNTNLIKHAVIAGHDGNIWATSKEFKMTWKNCYKTTTTPAACSRVVQWLVASSTCSFQKMTECWGLSISRVDVTALKQFKLWYSVSTSHQRCQNRSPLSQNGWVNTSSPLATRIDTSPSKTYPSSRRRRIVWLTSATSIKCNSNSVFFFFYWPIQLHESCCYIRLLLTI